MIDDICANISRMNRVKHLDCTLRDGGYYNDWDFDPQMVASYLESMDAIGIDFVEIGFRSLKNNGFKGPYAYSKDSFLEYLEIPESLNGKIGVMVNGSELSDPNTQIENLEKLFGHKSHSSISLVRIACHFNEFSSCLPIANWLKEMGYLVGFNLMQIGERTPDEIEQISSMASEHPIDVLYFADSLGSLFPDDVSNIVLAIRKNWKGELGIHTHDNTGKAIANTIQAISDGATWVDSTVTGMGRGAGNAQTEYLTQALSSTFQNLGNPTKLFEVISKYFKPMQQQCGWGTNPYYYMAGEFGIHPTYVQQMLLDSRYSDEDIITVLEYLKQEGGKSFSLDKLETARLFYTKDPIGTWSPSSLLKDREVLIIGSGPSVKKYSDIIEQFIHTEQPQVIALNTQADICDDLIHARAACHPVRLLADCEEHLGFPQPLITPASMLDEDIKKRLKSKNLLDYGISLAKKGFSFHENFCELRVPIVAAYVLALCASGRARQIYAVGFDGYSADDPRRKEMDGIFTEYENTPNTPPVVSLTPTRYDITVRSIYGLVK